MAVVVVMARSHAPPPPASPGRPRLALGPAAAPPRCSTPRPCLERDCVVVGWARRGGGAREGAREGARRGGGARESTPPAATTRPTATPSLRGSRGAAARPERVPPPAGHRAPAARRTGQPPHHQHYVFESNKLFIRARGAAGGGA